jgi:hypothetical protein
MNITYMTFLIYRDVTKMMGDLHQNLAQQEISYQNRLARDLGIQVKYMVPFCCLLETNWQGIYKKIHVVSLAQQSL